MNGNLVRTQMYVGSKDIADLDILAKSVGVTRSQIFRDAISAIISRYVDVSSMVSEISKKKALKAWMDLCGIEESKSGDLGERVDEIYNG